MKQTFISGPYITLGQLLKKLGVIDNGGYAARYLQEKTILVNGEREQRRGRKIYSQDIIKMPDLDEVRVMGR